MVIFMQNLEKERKLMNFMSGDIIANILRKIEEDELWYEEHLKSLENSDNGWYDTNINEYFETKGALEYIMHIKELLYNIWEERFDETKSFVNLIAILNTKEEKEEEEKEVEKEIKINKINKWTVFKEL